MYFHDLKWLWIRLITVLLTCKECFWVLQTFILNYSIDSKIRRARIYSREHFEDNEVWILCKFYFYSFRDRNKKPPSLKKKKINPLETLHKGSPFLMGEMGAVLLVWFVSLATVRDAGSLKGMSGKLSKTLKVIKENMVWKKCSRHDSQIYCSHFGSTETDQMCGEVISNAYWNFKGNQMAEVCVPCKNWLWILGLGIG